MAFPVGWTRRAPLVIQHGQVPANQTAFPVLITAACLPSEMVTSGGANAAQSNGGDIRFSSDSAGLSQLACEIVVWIQNATPSSANAEIWVAANILTAADVTIYVWYSAGGGQTQPAVNASFGSQAVWPSDYKSVWHLANGTTLSATESTSVGNNLNLSNKGTAQAGKIDGAASFTAANNEYLLASDAGFPTSNSDRTISAWINTTVSSSSGGITWFNYGTPAAGNNHWIALQLKGTGIVVSAYSNDTTIPYSWAANTWIHVVFTISSTTGQIYVNGATQGSSFSVSSYNTTLFGQSLIGALNVFPAYWPGLIDEVRVSNIARSANWILTEYNNQNSPTTFVIAGPPTGPGSKQPQPFVVT